MAIFLLEGGFVSAKNLNQKLDLAFRHYEQGYSLAFVSGWLFPGMGF